MTIYHVTAHREVETNTKAEAIEVFKRHINHTGRVTFEVEEAVAFAHAKGLGIFKDTPAEIANDPMRYIADDGITVVLKETAECTECQENLIEPFPHEVDGKPYCADCAFQCDECAKDYLAGDNNTLGWLCGECETKIREGKL